MARQTAEKLKPAKATQTDTAAARPLQSSDLNDDGELVACDGGTLVGSCKTCLQSLKLVSRRTVETCSIETQTLNTQALPPVSPEVEARRALARYRARHPRVRLNSRKLMMPMF